MLINNANRIQLLEQSAKCEHVTKKKKENETYKTDFMLLNRINDFLCVYLDMFV